VPDPNATRSAEPDDAATPSSADPAATGPGADPAATVSGPGTRTLADAPAPPASAGRYELGAEIARGGMGAVYRATDTAFAREVAVKVLLDKFAPTSGTARRFHDEARITGQLQHPNIPAVHDLGALPDGRPFLAMKLIKGATLDELLRTRPDPSADRGRFVAAFEQVCQAVAYAHAHDVIHRDLKPGNVMVGNFGEVQVMDWGLAKVLGSHSAEETDPDGTAPGTAIQSIRESDSAFTQAGSVLGTPAYMPPEQAIGAIHKVDARSDVFGLGAILAVILTGKPPFAASSVETTRLQAAQGNLEECFARLDASGAEPELVSLCKRCLSKKPADRPADAGEVARAVAALRAAADERARQAELDRVKAEGDKVAAELRVEGERQKAEEQRKRRRVQLALAGFVVLVAIGGGIAATVVQQERAEKQREADRLANEKQRAEDNLVAETKRQTDLRAADAAAQEKQRVAQRETRAGALVDALSSAETVAVPRLVNELKEFRDLTGAKLRERAGPQEPIRSKAELHARLALLVDEPPAGPAGLPQAGRPAGRAAELAAYLPVCKPEELLTIRDALKPYAGTVSAGLWAVLTDAKAEAGNRVRAACALAGLAPEDEQWKAVAPAVSELVVQENPLSAAVWFEALEPVRGALVPALTKRYPEARSRLRGEKQELDEVRLATEVSGYDLTATALARYTADRPAEAAELMLLVDPRHASQFVPAVRANKAAVVPVLKAELAKTGEAGWKDEEHEALARRRAQAGAVLLTLGEGESVWPLFAFPKDGDPTARSYLLARLVDLEADPVSLMRRFEVEPDVSAKRALLVALGGFPVEVVPAAERGAFAVRLLTLYREHPDPGLHGAIEWLLRQKTGGGPGEPAGGSPDKWGKAKELAAIDGELSREARGRMAARALAGAGVPVGLPSGLVGPQLPAPAVAVGKDWFVNGEGQTFAVVRGPVEFTLGSPKTEPGRNEVNEPPHRKRIGRTFAIGTKEVTVAQFLRFRPKHEWTKQYSEGPDTPMVNVTWYDGAAYCNWLSAREGIPPDQWCYEPVKDPVKGEVFGEGMRMKVGHLKLTGYRLPTEPEWEFACRSGSVTSRYHGRGEDLLPRYGWFAKNAENRAWPVGVLRPNELGLFDMLGNALEWVEDPAFLYARGQMEDIENLKLLLIDERTNLLLRGGSFYGTPVVLRSANRSIYRPGNRNYSFGFRPARTLY
jgi:formylglycine-generating enzyme required for sulfatase activity/tRNA A-37 threonylcarbamoyl transferase component Bud32